MSFDFGRWVDDRERISRLYLDRGYFSARIVPTRRAVQNAGAEPRVALDYRITRGPRTVLTMSGYDPPPERCRSASAGVGGQRGRGPDRRRSRAGRPQSPRWSWLPARQREGEVDETIADQLTASVQVDPGPVTTERHLAFSGNTVLSEKELLDLAGPANLDGAGVEEPGGAAGDGGVRIRGPRIPRRRKPLPAPIAFAGDAATLPIRIVEGPHRAGRDVHGHRRGARSREGGHRGDRTLGGLRLRGRRRTGAATRHGAPLPQPRIPGRRGRSRDEGECSRGARGHRRQRAVRVRSTWCSRCAPPASRARATHWWSGRRGFRRGRRPAPRWPNPPDASSMTSARSDPPK